MGYLIETWPMHSAWPEPLDQYLADADAERARGLALDCNAILEMTDSELERVLSVDLDVLVVPESLGLTWREWLGQVREAAVHKKY